MFHNILILIDSVDADPPNRKRKMPKPAALRWSTKTRQNLLRRRQQLKRKKRHRKPKIFLRCTLPYIRIHRNRSTISVLKKATCSTSSTIPSCSPGLWSVTGRTEVRDSLRPITWRHSKRSKISRKIAFILVSFLNFYQTKRWLVLKFNYGQQ